MVVALQWNKHSSSRSTSTTNGIVMWSLWLVTLLCCQRVAYICDNCKFSAHFIGPFKVLKHIGKFAYRIELPPINSALHNVLHVSKLKLYIPSGGDGTNTNVQPVLVDG